MSLSTRYLVGVNTQTQAKVRKIMAKDLVIDKAESQVPVVVDRPLPVERPEAAKSIIDLLHHATNEKVSPEALERYFALYEKDRDYRSMQEFNGAMAEFQATCPPVRKTSTADIVTKSGSRYKYEYAELDEIARTVRPHLQRHGLSYSWDSSEKEGQLVCVCTVRHANGHFITATFRCPYDSAANMSGAQKSAAALTYARRQSLIQALGLTTCDPDIDGEDNNPEKITDHEAANLSAALDDVGGDKAAFLKFLGVAALSDLPKSKLAAAFQAIEQKRRAKK